MKDLASFIEEKIQGFNILPRRYSIKSGKINLYGPPKSGKTSLALDVAKTYKYAIYIDCNDPRNNTQTFTSQILKAFLEKKLELLILDNFQKSFMPTLPNITNIILITPTPLFSFKDFHKKSILSLIFEEYISFSSSTSSLNQLFNTFLKYGNSPMNISLSDYQKNQRKQESMQLFFKENYDFFLHLLSFQSQKITTNQFYTYLKKYLKISKDKTYQILQDLENQKFIFFIAEQNAQKKAKKIYFYDFSLPYAFLSQPNFQSIFENLVFLELKNQYKGQITTSKECHFLIKEKAFFAIPFPNQKDIDRILEKNKNKEIFIITINPLEHSQCHIIDFVSFALGEYLEEK
ncbi:ATP-binding protein [Helicobacter anatolicus]|uniref:AAA family ATPase n=1 Tax=Helicobacter anatolicus TaxID=2905874 RepID=UPI001E53B8C6|nr:AAA family ATPase [Helicobacter anatolicus]MCE3037713.1 ATP-binding protein [Helicobacter anatolicus]